MSYSYTDVHLILSLEPWVTKETTELLHYWFNSRITQTLLEVAETIEAWATREHKEEIQQTKASINKMSCCLCRCPQISFNKLFLKWKHMVFLMTVQQWQMITSTVQSP